MGIDIHELIGKLKNISDVSDEDPLKLLDGLVQDLAETEQPELAIEALLQVFERFPENDGYGVFWTILHALESLQGYESFLLASLQRRPSEFTITMA